MLLNQFKNLFPTEESCIDYFKNVRSKSLDKCLKCGCIDYYWLSGKQTFECKSCHHRIPLTKGTVMEHSKLPLRTWFYTMHLMTFIKQVLSAKEVQHQLHLSQYPPVWLMMMKLRNLMGKRENIYRLTGTVELNEYCWKFNRRFFRNSTEPRYDLFDRLVRISALYKSDVKWRDYALEEDDDEL